MAEDEGRKGFRTCIAILRPVVQGQSIVPLVLSFQSANIHAQETVGEIEKLEDEMTKNKANSSIKKAIVKGIPRRAVLKPTHAIYRLQSQQFALGDRVTMVQDSGGVPLSVKGVVIGLNAKTMDVIWDVPFISGGTLGDRCVVFDFHSSHWSAYG